MTFEVMRRMELHLDELKMEKCDLEQENAQLKDDLSNAERALMASGYRKSCDIPACNCGDQWGHGGLADERLREISDALPYVNGKTILSRVQDIVNELEHATQRKAQLQEALHELVGQVEQARDGFGIYHDCPSMTEVLSIAKQALKESI